MNDELQNQIASLVEAAKHAGKDSADFIQQQAPDVIAQLVRWKIAEGVCETLAGLAAMGFAYLMFRWMRRYLQGGDFEDHPEIILPGMAMCAVFIAGCCAIGDGVPQTLKAVVAPKVLIIETIAGIVKH